MITIAERVAAGAAFLDEHDPEWWREDVERAIDLDALDLADTTMCVLGQRCPLENDGFAFQAVHLTGNDELTDGKSLWEWAMPLGFALDVEHASYLADEWARVITDRRSAS